MPSSHLLALKMWCPHLKLSLHSNATLLRLGIHSSLQGREGQVRTASIQQTTASSVQLLITASTRPVELTICTFILPGQSNAWWHKYQESAKRNRHQMGVGVGEEDGWTLETLYSKTQPVQGQDWHGAQMNTQVQAAPAPIISEKPGTKLHDLPGTVLPSLKRLSPIRLWDQGGLL